jgi:hypothetical protein
VAKDKDVVLVIDALTVGASVKLSHDIEILVKRKEITHNSPLGYSNRPFNLQSKVRAHQDNVSPFKRQHKYRFGFCAGMDQAVDVHPSERNSTWG